MSVQNLKAFHKVVAEKNEKHEKFAYMKCVFYPN